MPLWAMLEPTGSTRTLEYRNTVSADRQSAVKFAHRFSQWVHNMDSVVKSETQQLEILLKKVGAWQTGHFLLTSGLHSNEYIQCQRLLQYPRYGMVFAEALLQRLRDAGITAKTVVGPALGAVHWEMLVALAIDKTALDGEPARGIFAERPDGTFEIRRGVELAPGEEVIVVEDVTTTGGSARDVVELVRKLGAKPVAVGTIIDRSGGTAKFDVPFFPLIRLNLATYQPDACPLCKEGTPLVKLGSKKK
jgi:orotate phosphoribosyltransferase